MLLKDYRVIRPKTTKVQLVRNDTRYVYQVVDSEYKRDKKYTIDKRVNIGKMVDDTYMIPNDKFILYYPDLIRINNIKEFSDTLSVGSVVLINKVFNDTGISEILNKIFKDKSCLIKDLVAYMIIKESSEYEYFKYYERKYITFTSKVYSDSIVLDLLNNQITNSDINAFIDNFKYQNIDYKEENLDKDIFLSFIASIVRSEISNKVDGRKNLSVEVIIKELDAIEASIGNNNIYLRRYVFTDKQGEILDLFDIEEEDVDNLINVFNRSYL